MDNTIHTTINKTTTLLIINPPQEWMTAVTDKKGESANCDNTNVNLNDINQLQRQNQVVGNTIGTAATLNGESLTGNEALNALTGNGDGTGGLLNLDRNIINICINSNDNTLTGTFTAEQSQPPTEPQTCEECFQAFLTRAQIDSFIDIVPFATSLEDVCFSFSVSGIEDEVEFDDFLVQIGVDDPEGFKECL